MTRDALLADLERACRTLRRMKFPRNGAPLPVDQALGCHLPEPPPDPHTAYGADKERVTRALPTAEDLDHFDRVWPLMLRAPCRDRGLVYVRLAHEIGWRSVGRIFDCTAAGAQYRFNRAVDAIDSGT